MLSILKVSIANLKKKKIQNLLIGIVLMVASMLLAMSLNMTNLNGDSFENINSKMKFGHDSIAISNSNHSISSVESWWKNNDNISSVQSYPYRETDIVIQGSKDSYPVLLTEKIINTNMDNLKIIEGTLKEAPSIGEVWLPSGYAYGRKIKLNDDIYLSGDKGNIKFKVSAIVVDPTFSSGFITPCRIWIKEGSLSSLGTFSKLASNMLSIKYKNYSPEISTTLTSKFIKEFSSLNATVYDYETTKGTYLLPLTVIGSVMAIMAVLLIIISLYIIYTTISAAIISDYKNIGIFKALGFTSLDVIYVYIIQYGVLASIFILFGILLSKFTFPLILINVKGVVGIIENDFILYKMIMLFFFLIALILIVVYTTAVKCKKISPVEAIVFGTSSKAYNKPSLLKINQLRSFSIPVILGIKNIFYAKKQSLFFLITSSVSTIILVFSITVGTVFINLPKNSSDIGFVDSDIYITRNSVRISYSHEALLEKLKSEKNIDKILFHYHKSFFVYNETKSEYEKIIGDIYSNSLDTFNFKYLSGVNPKNSNEIAIAITSSKELKKTLGDTITFNIEGTSRTFIISGIYQTINNMGKGFRMLEATYKEINPIAKPINYNLILKANVSKKDYIQELKRNLGSSVDVMDYQENIYKAINPLINSMVVLLTSISVIFIIVSFIIVIASTSISVNSNKKIYGIYKSLGITSHDIRLSIIYTIGICTISGVIIGIFVTSLIASKLVALLLSFVNLNLTINFNFIHLIIVSLVCFGINALSVWISSRKIKNITPKNLIVE